MKRLAILVALIVLIGAVIWANFYGSADSIVAERPRGTRMVAVAVAPVTQGPIVDIREFTGSLRASEAFTVAPKISGRIARIHVDIGDRVQRGTLMVELDDAEFRQAVAMAEASLAVARAELRRAESEAALAARELQRTQQLSQRDLVSAGELDTVQARADSQQAAVAVAAARVQEREAALLTEQVRLGYTVVRADWNGSIDTRLVGDRHANAGDTVAANTALLTVLGVERLMAVAYASERDYPLLAVGQTVTVVADALPEHEFAGVIARIAPRFEEVSRQARFEVTVTNQDELLKPGMFITVRVAVNQADDATLVPADAVVQRDGQTGVYQIRRNENADRTYAHFVPISIGIRDDQYAQVLEPELSGEVVTLGQQLLADGSPVNIAQDFD
jgi:RND family efflux transporter MFP subunit